MLYAAVDSTFKVQISRSEYVSVGADLEIISNAARTSEEVALHVLVLVASS